jgi:hypothetical protein
MRLTKLRTVVASCALALVWLGCGDIPTDVGSPGDLGPNISVVSQAALDHAIRVQEAQTDGLLALDAVVGTAVGLSNEGRPVVMVYLKDGRVQGVPVNVEGVPFFADVTGEFFALQGQSQAKPEGKGKPKPSVDRTARFDRPVPIGVSTGHPAVTAGTIGARVTDGNDVWALSNNHVYADENQAPLGDAVIQPGTFDGGSSPADDIGTLYDFEPIVFSTTASNVIDAAIASSTTANLGNSTPSDGYGTPKSETAAPTLNTKVLKYGRTTAQTEGTIAAINATVLIGYSTGTARFVDQIIITPGSFGAGGDSGSLIVVKGKGRNKADDGKPVGLLYAGSAFQTIANPIDAVLARFGVTIDGN